MKRHLTFLYTLIFLGIFIFCSCGNDGKVKPDSNLNKGKEIVDLVDTTASALTDSMENKALLAEANEKNENLEETKAVKKQTSFNPPHIPVFNEEKVEEKKVSSTKPEEAKTKRKPKKKSKPLRATNSGTDSATKPVHANSNKQVKQAPPKSGGKDTEIVWRRNFYSFGDIIQGDTVYFKFEFTNIGDHPLEIESATASCGCTHPSFSFIPVESSEKGEIKGMYISDETKKGTQNAMIMVIANTEPPVHKLYIDGNVLLPDGNSKDPEVESKGN